MQTVFNLPSFCTNVLDYFSAIPEEKLNATSRVFIKKLKEKKAINEGSSSNKVMDLSELRSAFNTDLELRHRDKDNTFGMK